MKVTQMGGRVRRVVATAGALALGVMGAVAFATPASAATVPNIPDGPYNIAIHKFVQPSEATGLPHNGTELTPGQLSGLQPLEGVTYKVQQVTSIDLSTTAGWEETQGLTAQDVLDNPSEYPLSTGGSDQTNSNGEVVFPEDLGVYLVSETDAGDNQITELAPPFLVTVPFPNNGGWLTTVNVYPKNPVTGIEKTVDDSDAHGLGDTVDWTIKATVPYIPDGQSLDSFGVTDTLDGRLTYVPTATVSFAEADGTNVPLDSSDYTITAPVVTGGTLEVNFTTAGVSKLAQHQGGTVTVGVETTVTSVGDGTIQNTGVVNINDSSYESTPTQTTWGALELKKVAADSNDALQDAGFQVYLSQDDAKNGTNPVSVNGETTFTTGADGTVSIDGLKSQNDGTGDNLTYYLVETNVPAGYLVAPGYDAASGGHAITVLPGTTSNALITITDPQVPAFVLPLTGSTGTALFVGGGIALIVIAMGAAIVLYRRKTAVVHE